MGTVSDDDRRDPATGLLHRKAFLAEVHEAQSSMPERMRRGCLLILQFPVIQSLVAAGSDESADDALRHLLAIVETRVRTRDSLGRISRHSLCLLLKGCKEPDAVVVADQYVALLRNIVVEVAGRQLPMDLRYRIVPLDARGSRPRQGVSRMVMAPPVGEQPHLSKQIDIAGNRVDLTSSKVISLNDARTHRPAAASGQSTNEPKTSVISKVLEVGARDQVSSWRLRPGMLVQRKPLVCCFRMQPVGVVSHSDKLQNSDSFAAVLRALSLSNREVRPVIESQIIVPVRASQIDVEFPKWVAEKCKSMRIAPSDVCLSISVETLSDDLRSVAPVLRVLNRNGIRLMLEGVGSSSQFRMMKNVAQFDYIHISGRTLNDSLIKHSVRTELELIVTEAKLRHCEICSGGVDSDAIMKHAMDIGIEIGFGRLCGASVAFPEEVWVDIN